MRICVAGADCFIGKHLIQKLTETDNDIVALVRTENAKCHLFGEHRNLKVFPLDFENYETMGDVIGEVDCLMVLTWIGTRGQDRMNENLQKANYLAVKAAILGAIEKGCKRVLTAGSQAEYGIVSGPISELTKCNPNTEYGIYKLKLFEDLTQICGEKKVSYKEPRFFSLYGPGDYSGTLIMSSIVKMQQNEECDFTESTQLWDYLYVEDAADAVTKLCTEECADGPYIFGSGDKRQLKDYISELKTILNSHSNLNFGVVPYGLAGVVTIEPDISKLSRELNWRPKHSFREGIIKTMESL